MIHPIYYNYYCWLLDLLLRGHVAEILSGAESDFLAGEKDCSIQRRKKKGANGFLVKEIHVSGLTGSEYC